MANAVETDARNQKWAVVSLGGLDPFSQPYGIAWAIS